MCRTWRPLAIGLACWAMICAPGCYKALPSLNLLPKKSAKDLKPNLQPGQMQVLAQGGLTLEAQKDKQRACGELLAMLDQLITAQRMVTARRVVWRHPDLSIEILQTATAERLANKTIQFVAQARDSQCGASSPTLGWQGLLADRLAHPEHYAEYDKTRVRLFEEFKLGEASKACDLPLMKLADNSPSPLLMIDATMLTATAQLFAERATDAVATFAKAFELARPLDPQQAAYAQLMLSDAQRLAGDASGAAQHWRDATLAAAECLERPIPILDPVFWERASYLRPAQESWPEPVLQQFRTTSGLNYGQQDASTPVAGGQSETPLFASLAKCRYQRNEPQAALLAFKRAETSAVDPVLQAQLRREEAKCLTRLMQDGAATAILMGMVNQAEPAIKQPALALLGSIKLQGGQAEFGQRLLSRALEADPKVDWGERSDAEADLGLAYLLQGDETNGLRLLHAAQQHFAAAGQHELLVKCLWNEARYFEHKGKHSHELQTLEAQIKSLENGDTYQAAF